MKTARNFVHENRHLEESFRIQRDGIFYNIIAPYSAQGQINSRNITEFKGDPDREDNYESRSLNNIYVTIGDIEKVWDDEGNKYDSYEFILTPEEEQMMEKEVEQYYINSI